MCEPVYLCGIRLRRAWSLNFTQQNFTSQNTNSFWSWCLQIEMNLSLNNLLLIIKCPFGLQQICTVCDQAKVPDSSDAHRSVSSKIERSNDYFICIHLNKHESVHRYSDVMHSFLFIQFVLLLSVFLLLWRVTCDSDTFSFVS